MKKKVLTGLLLVLAAAVSGLYIYRVTRPSPAGSAELTAGGVTVSVSYSRPSVRSRIIFGTKETQALQPYGVYWRLGANKATEITFSRDVTFNGQPVQQGTYRMYAVPGATSFELVLNSELGKSGSEMPDPSRDVLRTGVAVQSPGEPVEKFTISMEPATQGVDVVFTWSDVKLVVPVRRQ